MTSCDVVNESTDITGLRQTSLCSSALGLWLVVVMPQCTYVLPCVVRLRCLSSTSAQRAGSASSLSSCALSLAVAALAPPALLSASPGALQAVLSFLLTASPAAAVGAPAAVLPASPAAATVLPPLPAAVLPLLLPAAELSPPVFAPFLITRLESHLSSQRHQANFRDLIVFRCRNIARQKTMAYVIGATCDVTAATDQSCLRLTSVL